MIPATLFSVLFAGNPPASPTGVTTFVYSTDRIGIQWDAPPAGVDTRVYRDSVLLVTVTGGGDGYETGLTQAAFEAFAWEVSHVRNGKESNLVIVSGGA